MNTDYSRSQNNTDTEDVVYIDDNRINDDTHGKFDNEDRQSISSDDTLENEASSSDNESDVRQSKQNEDDKIYNENSRNTSVKNLASRFSTTSNDDQFEVRINFYFFIILYSTFFFRMQKAIMMIYHIFLRIFDSFSEILLKEILDKVRKYEKILLRVSVLTAGMARYQTWCHNLTRRSKHCHMICLNIMLNMIKLA